MPLELKKLLGGQMPFWVYAEIEKLHGVIKDIHSAKKFLKLNFTKRGETIFGECISCFLP